MCGRTGPGLDLAYGVRRYPAAGAADCCGESTSARSSLGAHLREGSFSSHLIRGSRARELSSLGESVGAHGSCPPSLLPALVGGPGGGEPLPARARTYLGDQQEGRNLRNWSAHRH
ncbi:hypothetical protein NDU88_005752 [Pleurodeles waltl]|uniref:Uncharacterized protein n=1 Tax=Pleurodeles waltl TaxID=8319 RepID=A0AAV7TBH2_PLEWA|nr:hypothetical protein NDU88_005752 [Pleurodeles waltl]